MKPLIFVISFFLFVSTAFAVAVFTDVNEGNPVFEAITYLKENGVLDGYPDGSFKPDGLINRAEFTKVLIAYLFEKEEFEDCVFSKVVFSDLDNNEWYFPYVCKAYEEGIISGYPDGTFKPEQNVNFAEAAKIVVNSLVDDFEYVVAANDDWFKPFVDELSRQEAVPDTISKFDKKLTRGEVSHILYAIIANEDVVVEADWWRPEVGLSWFWQLEGELQADYDVDVYDIDLFETDKAEIDGLKDRGVKVICYFSAGTYEDWREDASGFTEEIIGNELEDWPDEKWLDVSNFDQFSLVMEERMDLAVSKGCDGVEPDNVDGFDNDSGFDLSADDQLAFNTWLANQAHQRGLAVGLKNDLSQIEELVDFFDFAVNEQCFEYEECEELTAFVDSGKPVFGVEYELSKDEFCEEAVSMGFSWLKMYLDLSGEFDPC